MDKEAIATAATKVTYGGAGTTVLGGLTLNEWGIAIGVAIGILGYVTNTVFKYLDRKDKRLHYKRIEEQGNK